MAEAAKHLRKTQKHTRTIPPIDWPFAILVLILTGFGLVMVFSASSAYAFYHMKGDSLYYIRQQVLFACVGLAAMVFFSFFDYHLLEQFSYPLIGVAWALLILVMFMPEYNYAHRWITLPGGLGTFQPSEIAKFAIILSFAHLSSANHERIKTFRFGVLPFLILLLPTVGLVIIEPHLSGTVLLLGIGVLMMFVGGTALRWFVIALGGVAAAIGGVALLVPSLVTRAMSRITYWRDPWSDALGKGHQTIQSLYAIGSGGLLGLGIGNSRQKHLYVPEPANDFIFSILCEELGFVGAMLVILLFIALLIRGIYVAYHARDKFGAMLVVGILIQVTMQAAFNIAVVTNTVPNTGISLPFFSYGGTALTMLLAEMGIVLSVSRQSAIQKL